MAVQQAQNKAKAQPVQVYQDIKGIFLTDQVQRVIKSIIPKTYDAARLLEVTLISLRDTPKLLECEKGSVIAGVMGILKLALDVTLKQAHLVPFWNTKKGLLEAQLIIDYRGWISLARRSGEIQKVSPHIRYQKDTWQMQYGTNESLYHVPADGDRGEILGAYVIYTFKDGSTTFEYMPKSEIDKRMEVSKAKDAGPWQDWYEEMAKKTVIKHSIKYLPITVEEARVADAIEDRSAQVTLAGDIDLLGQQDILKLGRQDGEIETEAKKPEAAKPEVKQEPQNPKPEPPKPKPGTTMPPITASPDIKKMEPRPKPEPAPEPAIEPEVVSEPPKKRDVVMSPPVPNTNTAIEIFDTWISEKGSIHPEDAQLDIFLKKLAAGQSPPMTVDELKSNIGSDEEMFNSFLDAFRNYLAKKG